MPHSPWRQRRNDSQTGRPVASSPAIASSSVGVSSDSVSTRTRSGGCGSSANRRASRRIVPPPPWESTSPLSERATAASPSRPASCTAWRARRRPRRPTSIQCTGWSRSAHSRGPSEASADARPHVLVEMTSQPASRYWRWTRRTASGFSISARVPHSGSSSASLEPAACGSSVPRPPSRMTQRAPAIDSATRPYAVTLSCESVRYQKIPAGSVAHEARRGGQAVERLGADHRQAERATDLEELLPRVDGAVGVDDEQIALGGLAKHEHRPAREPALGDAADRRARQPGVVEQAPGARTDERQRAGGLGAIGAAERGAVRDRLAYEARPARCGAPRADDDDAVR